MKRKIIALFMSFVFVTGAVSPVFGQSTVLGSDLTEKDNVENEGDSDGNIFSDNESEKETADEFDLSDEETDIEDSDIADEDIDAVEDDIVFGEEVKNDLEADLLEDGFFSGEENEEETSETAGEIIESGTLQNGGEWTLDDKGVYTVTGKGEYIYFAGTDYSKVKKVVIEGEFRFIDVPVNESFVEYEDEGVEYIECWGGAFAGCSNLSSIEIPNGVLQIGACAFYNCSSLEKIQLPEGMTKIRFGTFYNCRNLNEIQLPEGVTEIGFGAFQNCENIRNIDLPKALAYIGEYAFDKCSNLYDIELPKNITDIDSAAFRGCKNLRKIEIPAKIKSIGKDVFANCINLKKCIFAGNRPNNFSGFTSPQGLTVYYHGNISSWSKQKAGVDKKGIKWVNMDKTSLQTPALVSASNIKNGVEVKWKASNGAKWYRVFRKSGSGSWTKIADTQDLTYVDTKVASGKSYVYTVRCLNAHRTGYVSGFDKNGKSVIYLAQGVISKAVALRSGGILITWNKIAGAKGYVVYRKDGKSSYKRIKIIANGKTVTFKDTTAKTGQKYIYAVRPYSGKYKGDFKGRMILPTS